MPSHGLDYSPRDVSFHRQDSRLDAAPRAAGSSPQGIRWGRTVWTPLLAIGLLAVLTTLARPEELMATLAGTRLVPVFQALGVMAILMSLEAFRVRWAFGRDRFSFPAAIGLTLRSALLAQLTPGMVGGEIYKIVWLRRRGARPLPTIFMLGALRLLGFGSQLLLALLALPLLLQTVDPRAVSGPTLRWVGVALLGCTGVLVAALLIARRRLGATVQRAMGEAWAGLRQLGAAGAAALGGASLLIGLARGATVYLLLAALGQRLEVLDVVAASAIASLSSVLPVVPGGLGVQEGALAVVLIAAGASPPEAVSTALLNRSLQWLAAIVGGLWFLKGVEAR